MNKKEISEIGTRELIELVRVKTNLTEIGAHAYALSLAWSFADNKTKQSVVKLIEGAN